MSNDKVDPAASTSKKKSGKSSKSKEPSEFYDVIIIGTGFGAVAALTTLLDEKGKKDLNVLLIERGTWWYSPEVPTPPYFNDKPDEKSRIQFWPRPNHDPGLTDFLAVVKSNILSNPLTPRGISPLYYYNSFDEIDIITAGGVGGGSLVYSNVTIEPQFENGAYPIMADWPAGARLEKTDYVNAGPGPIGARQWMEKWRGKLNKVVTKFPIPADLAGSLDDLDNNHRFLYLGRSRALADAAKTVNVPGWKKEKWAPLELSIFEYGDTKKDGTMVDTICERQGRCFVGCLPKARHTINKLLVDNILTAEDGSNQLKYRNVRLKSLTEVDRIQFVKGRPNAPYTVWCRNSLKGDGLTPIGAQKVIVSAGTLGTQAILQRSRAKKTLNLSAALGEGFSSNGDFAGFVVNLPETANPIFPTRGPINQSHIGFTSDDGSMRVNVEDGGIPAMFAAITRTTLNLLQPAAPQAAGPGAPGVISDIETAIKDFTNAIKGLWKKGVFSKLKPANFAPLAPGKPNPKDANNYQTEDEMLERVFFFNSTGSDRPIGTFSWDDDKLKLSYDLTKQPIFDEITKIHQEIAKAMQGTYLDFPLWEGLGLPKKGLTVHPLGGCRMADSATNGVVNFKGQVFRGDGASTRDVYDGLYVIDASVFPGPVAVNPTLSIVALALRIARQIRI